MSKYLPIALVLTVFVAIPALAKAVHQAAKPSTYNLVVSAATAPSPGATTRVARIAKRHNSAGAPGLDCVQHVFGIDIALAC